MKYDSLGNIVEILYNNGSKIKYAYDDVGRLIREDNTILNKTFVFEYDAWGNHIVYKKTTSGYTINQDAGFIGNVNPIRYKEYYYYVETNLFLVSSRYYSPELCCWISPDDIEYLDPESVNGLNLYCYCLNNPIMYVDPSGHIAISTLILCGLVLVGMGLTIGGVVSDNNTMTAIGLTMVSIHIMISGVGLCLVAQHT